ncbi:AMP-binding protein [Pseudonocardia sp. NPDC049635]|uniref:AMP-binding protein n=1 Tax=Pseudonocardia sp. NPDC049635 TaxID=3155506 RepID=UPI0033D15D98
MTLSDTTRKSAVEPSRAVPTYTDLIPAELRREWSERGLYADVPAFDLFRAQALADPARVAVLDDAGSVTYGELLESCLCIAAGLRELGVGVGDVVAAQLPNSRRAVAVDLATAALGAAVLPFPAGRGDRDVRTLLRRSRASVLVTPEHYQDHDLVAVVERLRPELPALRHVVADRVPEATRPRPEITATFAELLSTDPVPLDNLPEVDPNAVVRLLVSSGTESEPKLVAYSHNALIGGRGRFLSRLQGDRPMRAMYLMPLGSSFGSGASFCVLALLGGSLVLRTRFDPGTALAALYTDRPTHLLGVPTMFQQMLAHPDLARTDTSSVRQLITGGALIDEATARRATEGLGGRLISLYGSADGVNCHTTEDDPLSVTVGTVGRPDPDVCAIRIVGEDGAPLGTGAIGRVHARGPMSPLCYVDAPELNDRYRLPGGWVDTGDLGYLDEDGRLRLTGRAKDIIIRGGGNISPAEVEDAISGHPGVLGVACVGVPDPTLGQRLCACVTVLGDRAPSLTELTTRLVARGLERRKLPEYLLVLPAFPIGVAGKIDKRALAARAREQFAGLVREGNGVVPGCEADLRPVAARRGTVGELAAAVRAYVDEQILPVERDLATGDAVAGRLLAELRSQARRAGLWGLGHATELGGAGLALPDYLLLAEQEGRTLSGPAVFGTETVLDVRMVHAHGRPALQEHYLDRMCRGELLPSFGMTEPGRAGSVPEGLATRAERVPDGWRITGRKWFISNAGIADLTVVVARTGDDGFSVFLVPTSAPGYRRVRPLTVLGGHSGQWEIELDGVVVDDDHLVGVEGGGLQVIQERLTLGRTLRAMHWIGLAQRAFDLMCARLREREVHGGPLGGKQLMHEHVFAAYTGISAARSLVRRAAARLDAGQPARVEVAAAKVAASRIAVDVIDRAVQVHGAEGLSDETPLAAMVRAARATRIYDGADEVHTTTAATWLLRGFDDSPRHDFVDEFDNPGRRLAG